MSNFDKDDTFMFEPGREEKPHVNRTANDTYSSARKVRYKKEEEKTDALKYVAIILAILLVITIGVAVFIFTSGGENAELREEPPVITENEEEEEEPEVIVNSYGIIFNYERIFLLENGNGYGISSELYDERNNKIGTKVLRVTEETEIRDNGTRMSMDAFISVVENQGGDLYVFKGEVREEDNVVLLITYDSRAFVEEEIPEVPEITETPDVPETPAEEPEEIPGEAIE